MNRGSKYVIKDVEEHFKLKEMIKNRMIQISSILHTEDKVMDEISEIFYMDNSLPMAMKKRAPG